MPRRIYRVEVELRPHLDDLRGQAVMADASALGMAGIGQVDVADLYFLAGSIDESTVDRVARELLSDPVVTSYRIVALDEAQPQPVPGGGWWVEVCLLPGVTDPEADSILAAAARIGVEGLDAAASAARYRIVGDLSEADVHQMVQRLLCNSVIQRYSLDPILPDLSMAARAAGSRVETVSLEGLSDEELLRTSRERVLSLSLEEMVAVREYFRSEGRDPTDVELETIAQTWSEHCGHKTFRATVDYEERRADGTSSERINSILRTYLASATREVAKPWVRSAFVDNAGIIDFDEDTEVSFKVETHNHPSALEPFGGANTGVGGVVRDVIGVSARPIANTDVLCFGYQDRAFDDLPEGVLHPRRIFSGVVAGIEDYGNKMGIPTVNGAILFDDGYLANPLVYCGCVGIAPKGLHPRAVGAGDTVVMMGGRIGRDGLHGATFSSVELAHDTGTTVGSVVQIGNPITEKKVLEAIMEARDQKLYSAITDCGAGGLSSAVGEMGETTGVSVELSQAPLKYPGLEPWEIWLSEAQERMVLAVPPTNLPALQSICDRLDVEMTVIGHFTDDGRLRVHYQDRPVADISMAFLHNGIPTRHLTAVWQEPSIRQTPPARPATDLSGILLRLLAAPNIASKEAVIRRYDHEVQGATVVKPLAGAQDGPADAAVLRSTYAGDRWRGIALGCGINPRYGALDPLAMAASAIDEAVRNVVCVGADPDQTAILDNFCWGNPNLPDRMGSLVRAAKGCCEAAKAFGTPFISGKDSLNNEYSDGSDGPRISIPPSLLISSIGIVPDVRRAVTMDLKKPGNQLFLLGRTRDELGGSHYGLVLDEEWGTPPRAADDGLSIARALHKAIRQGLVRSCHDCSEGGLAVAAAEMCLAGGLGLALDLAEMRLDDDAHRTDLAFFSESNSRYLVEVAPGDMPVFMLITGEIPWALIGSVTAEPRLRATGLDGEAALDVSIDELHRAWSDQSYVRPTVGN